MKLLFIRINKQNESTSARSYIILQHLSSILKLLDTHFRMVQLVFSWERPSYKAYPRNEIVSHDFFFLAKFRRPRVIRRPFNTSVKNNFWYNWGTTNYLICIHGIEELLNHKEYTYSWIREYLFSKLVKTIALHGRIIFNIFSKSFFSVLRETTIIQCSLFSVLAFFITLLLQVYNIGVIMIIW